MIINIFLFLFFGKLVSKIIWTLLLITATYTTGRADSCLLTQNPTSYCPYSWSLPLRGQKICLANSPWDSHPIQEAAFPLSQFAFCTLRSQICLKSPRDEMFQKGSRYILHSSWLFIVVVAKLHPTICNPTGCNTPGFPVLHYLPEFAQTHVHWNNDAIQPALPLSSSSPALPLAQHQGLFQWVSSSHQVAKYWNFSFSINPSNE